MGPAIDDGDPGIQPGKGGPSSRTIQYRTDRPDGISLSPAAFGIVVRPRRHCATVDFFFPPPPPLNRPASGHLERTVVSPLPPSPPLPSSVPVAGSFEIACGLVFDFPVSAPSPRCPPLVAATPPLPLEPPLGDDRYLFPSHELAFLVPDRGDVSEAGWARLIKPPLDLTTAHCSPVNAPVSRRAVEGWLPPASLPPVSPRPDGWRGSRRVRPTTRTR